MKNAIIFLFAFASFTCIVSCEKEDPYPLNEITGQGEIVNKTLQLAPYTQLELKGIANLYIRVGTEQSVTLKAQQNIIDVMTWQVSAGTLTIGLQEGVSIENHEEIRFEIDVMSLYSLLHDGIGNVILEGTNQEEFDIDYRGIGNVDAFDLPVDHCVVLNSGTGDCRVMVNDILEVDISALGNVIYRGHPEITLTDTGLGDLIEDN